MNWSPFSSSSSFSTSSPSSSFSSFSTSSSLPSISTPSFSTSSSLPSISTPSLPSISTPSYSAPTSVDFGNGGWKPLPTTSLDRVPSGTYGACLPPFEDLDNKHTTPQLSAPTIVKGTGYTRVEHNDGSGKYEVFNDLGQKTGGNY